MRILNLDADLGGAEAGIERRADVRDGAGEDLAGKGVEADVRMLAEMDGSEVVLIDVADDPDVREVGDGERALRAGVGDAGGASGGDILGDDDAGGGGVDLDAVAGMVFVNAEDAELLLGCLEIGFGVGFAVFGDLKLGFGDGTLVVEELVALKDDGGEVLVVDLFKIAIEGGGDVRALDLHDELALVDGLAELNMEGGDATVGEREDGDLAGDVRADGAGDV